MRERELVSIVIPTKNSAIFLENTLKSIKNQFYKKIETIIVDGNSTDRTLSIAKKYGAKIYNFVPKVKSGTFDAPYKRNFGVKKAAGEFVYYVDADMELSKGLVGEAVSICKKGYDAVILPEDSFGEGVWAKAKNLERRCYWGDDLIEAPRFFEKNVWIKLKGLDETLGGGGDDWDLYRRFKEKGYKVSRTKNLVMHNEGNLTLRKLIRKKFMYGRDIKKYFVKRPKNGLISYFPVRISFFRNWKLFVSRPKDTFYFIIMKSAESFSGLAGVLYSVIYD